MRNLIVRVPLVTFSVLLQLKGLLNLKASVQRVGEWGESFPNVGQVFSVGLKSWTSR